MIARLPRWTLCVVPPSVGRCDVSHREQSRDSSRPRARGGRDDSMHRHPAPADRLPRQDRGRDSLHRGSDHARGAPRAYRPHPVRPRAHPRSRRRGGPGHRRDGGCGGGCDVATSRFVCPDTATLLLYRLGFRCVSSIGGAPRWAVVQWTSNADAPRGPQRRSAPACGSRFPRGPGWRRCEAVEAGRRGKHS
jgi:hypothetical protein